MALQNRGILKVAQGVAKLRDIPVPKVRDDLILIKTIAVALNPTDWQTTDEAPAEGAPISLLGCDVAGIVLEAGDKVTRDFKKGDKIAGMSHGGNDLHPEYGCFADYVLIKGNLAFHIPDDMTFEAAAGLSCSVLSDGLGLYHHLGLPLSSIEGSQKLTGTNILIYGGSSATGQMAIQMAKLSGLTVITTASPHNFELVKNLGADHVFDYRDPDCGVKIRTLTNNELHFAYDTIAVTSSAAICAAALSSSRGSSDDLIYVGLPIDKFPRKDVRNIFFLGYDLGGERYVIENVWFDPDPQVVALGLVLAGIIERLLHAQKLRPHRLDVRDGLENVLEGMRQMKEGKHSGVKLIYRIASPK